MQILNLEDLVANLFLYHFINNLGAKPFLTFSEIESYGHLIYKESRKENIDIMLNLSRRETENFFRENYNFFRKKFDSKSQQLIGVSLVNSVTVDSLVENFRGFLDLDTLLVVIHIEQARLLSITPVP